MKFLKLACVALAVSSAACVVGGEDDSLLIGSPAGNGTHHGRFLRDGDVLEGEIAPLPGVLRNRCVGGAAA